MADKITVYQIDEKSSVAINGENNRNISFIVSKNEYESNQDLLYKIIQAVGLNLEKDISIIQLENAKGRIVLNELNRQSTSKHFFVFGLSKKQLGLQSDLHYHHPRVTENFVIHLSYSLDELASNTLKKKELWAYLKKIFK